MRDHEQPQTSQAPAEESRRKGREISWDEALDTVAQAMNSAKERYGAESVLFANGSPKGFEAFLHRLTNLFGTPNIVSVNHLCSIPRRPPLPTIGYPMWLNPDTLSDLDYPPACIMIWGANPAETHNPQYVLLEQALARGAKLIVVDPRRTGLASRADLWLQPRPGSDLALLLAMIGVIVNEGLFDKSFVDTWTVGFDKLREHIQSYTPQWAEEITWVPAEKIIEAARMYATTKPACIRDGQGVEENINVVQSSRAVNILRAITGNLDVPGGDIEWGAVSLGSRAEFTLADKLTEEQRKKKIGAELGFLPVPGLDSVLPRLAVKAILEEKPYPAKVLLVFGGNLLLSWENAEDVYKALMKLDFLAVADRVMTPTAELADIVLPAATSLECNDVSYRAPIAQVRQKVAQIDDCWPDKKILNELGKSLGFGEYFWDDPDESLDIYLKPLGVTFDEFRRMGTFKALTEYRKYLKRGRFNTPSGKVELYSSWFEEMGHEPLPVYHEPPETPYSAPELTKDYPLIMTNCHRGTYTHSDYRWVPSLRALDPYPTVEIQPETAKGLGIEDGDWVYIENQRGRIKQRAKLTDGILRGVIALSFAWWFPEQGIETLHGWREANVNILTPGEPYDPQIGSTPIRGLMCRVYKATE